MGCIKLSILDEQYRKPEIKVSSPQKKLTSDFSSESACSYTLFGKIISSYNSMWHQDIIPEFTFQAKPFDEENQMYYFVARYLPPGKPFISRDVKFEKYPWESPYCAFGNNPLLYIDPDGREKLIWLNKNKDQTIISGANNYEDDGAIHIFAHGSSRGITAVIDGKSHTIKTPAKLDELLSEHSETWKNKQEGDNITLVFHSCRTGQDGADGTASFAEKVSEAFENVKVIAPDERVYINSKEEIGTYKAKYTDDSGEYKRDGNGDVKSKERSNTQGRWRIFEKGKQTGAYRGNWKPKENPTIIDKVTKQLD